MYIFQNILICLYYQGEKLKIKNMFWHIMFLYVVICEASAFLPQMHFACKAAETCFDRWVQYRLLALPSAGLAHSLAATKTNMCVPYHHIFLHCVYLPDNTFKKNY